jgi:hypothetical protein
VDNIAAQLCWTLIDTADVPQVGYVATDRDPAQRTFESLVNEIAVHHPQIVLVQGGIRDAVGTPEHMTAAARWNFGVWPPPAPESPHRPKTSMPQFSDHSPVQILRTRERKCTGKAAPAMLLTSHCGTLG